MRVVVSVRLVHAQVHENNQRNNPHDDEKPKRIERSTQPGTSAVRSEAWARCPPPMDRGRSPGRPAKPQSPEEVHSGPARDLGPGTGSKGTSRLECSRILRFWIRAAPGA